MLTDEIANNIKEFVVENYLFGDDKEFTNNTSFLEKGIIDSTGVLEMITFLESTFGFDIEDSEIIPYIII
jgi:acyl carrier protein